MLLFCEILTCGTFCYFQEKKVKNIEFDDIGDKFGRVHMGKQDLDKLQTRKMKGLKRGAADDEEDDAGEAAGSGKRQRAEGDD